jgi:hypothetical protein
VPKSKVRKKPDGPTRPSSLVPVRVSSPSPVWYPIVMVVVLVLGLAYLVTYYLTSSGSDPHIPVMGNLASVWNFAIGFGVMLLGLIMAVRWR